MLGKNMLSVNTHECQTPEETSEIKEKLDNALEGILETKEVEDAPSHEVTEEILEQSAEAAAGLLKQDGWSILRQLYFITAQSIESTKVVIIPVIMDLDNILAKLSDPIAFKAILDNTRNDLSNMIEALEMLNNKHYGKKGIPSDDDLELINIVSLGYTKIQAHMDSAIRPLLFSLIETMQEAGVDTISLVKGE